MRAKIQQTIPFGVLLLASVTGQMRAQDQETRLSEFVPFQTFLEQTTAAHSVENLRPAAGVRVKGAASFQEMRQHLLNMYRGVEVKHSFTRDANHFDCIPIDQQPSVRMLGLEGIAKAPAQSLLAVQKVANDLDAMPTNTASQEPAESNDDFGNELGCEANTIPFRRLTLEEMARFPTLHDFFRKEPESQRSSRRPGVSTDAAESFLVPMSHKYSTMYRYINNIGGNSNLNLWSPYVNTGLGEIFSLSQEWYIGGSGASTQTAEVGWQNFPNKYGSQASRLFIYFTADNYMTTGCYNLDCPGFVQTSNSVHFGGAFGSYSSPGGAQCEVSAEYYFSQGNWWLAINGNWVGYYPGSLYRGGQLSRYATEIEFGTESVGTSIWPPEGSGYWSTSGFGYAAYQRNLFLFTPSGGTMSDVLTPSIPSPRCYSVSGPYFSSSSGWGAYFYEGGPGGSGCQ
jgi:hypothetical protein